MGTRAQPLPPLQTLKRTPMGAAVFSPTQGPTTILLSALGGSLMCPPEFPLFFPSLLVVSGEQFLPPFCPAEKNAPNAEFKCAPPPKIENHF